MKLLSLKGQNIGLLKGEFEFEFDDSLTVITGPIGCGKSTILTMIRASLTNSFPGTASSWASWGTPPQEACYFVASWRIGNRVLHIAKCVSGDRDFAAMNIPRLRIENDDGTVEDVHASREALERTHSLIPVPASIIDGHLIVDQDSITAPVSATPARFKETIHTLTRTSELENLRLRVRDLLSTVTVPDVEGPLAEAQTEVNRLKGEQAAVEQRLAAINEQQRAIGIADVNLQLETQELLKKNNEKAAELERSISDCNGSIAFVQSRMQDSLVQLARHRSAVDAGADSVEGYRKALYSIDAAKERYASKLDIQESLAKLAISSADLNARLESKPACEKVPADYIVKVQELRTSRLASMEALRKQIKLVEQGNCPTCGQSTKCPVSVDDLHGQLALYSAELAKVDQLHKDISECVASWSKYDSDARTWQAMLDLGEASRIKLEAELAKVADAEPVDEQSVIAMKRFVAAYVEAQKQVDWHSAGLAGMQKQQEDLNRTMDGLKARLADIPPQRFDAALHARLTFSLDTYRRLEGQRQEGLGELSATAKTLARAEERMKVHLDRKAKVEPTIRFREVLQIAEKALVKDALPKLLSAQYMGKLNERIQFYLGMINAEFTAHINADLEFMAKKTDGLVHRANRLSGGQKQQASVAYLLAVNDVFASTLGVLALDEPSGAMQESNSQDLAEAFSYLANLGQRTGRQFIVITHSAALAEYGCKQIKLEPST